ncbi:MAG: NTP transferase domain-containing protein [Firmicutes bacterium]|nr:NTP transferase domain-containing protein [Bacillota bacterium]
MKVIIPVAGVGTRLRPHTHTVPKALVHVAGKPILGHILDSLEPVGVTEVVLVVGYLGDQIIDYVRENYSFQVHFVEQEERRGLGHAIYLALRSIGPTDAPFLIVLGDTIFSGDLQGVIAAQTTAIGVKEVANPQNFGVVEVKNGNISRLVEKPVDPPSNLAVVGVYYIQHPPLLMECLERIIREDIRSKGEYQLTDALQLMLEEGEVMKTFPVGDWFDCGSPTALLSTNKVLLERLGREVQIPGSIIIPPVWIDPAAHIESSIIGPYVSIAEGAHVESSIIRNTIINKGARVENMLLDASLIGERALASGVHTVLNIGDSSSIEMVI